MIRVFSHWLPSKSVFQILFDLILLFCLMLLAAAWLNPDHLRSAGGIAPYALVFALTTIALNKAIGFYEHDVKRALSQTLALAIVSILLAMFAAYGIFGIIAKPGIQHDLLPLSALLALGAMAAVRVYTDHGGWQGVLARRVMILGTGAEAAMVEQSLDGTDVEIVGFYPVRGAEGGRVPQGRVLANEKSLADTTRRLKVGEIIVAVGERRGGMPLRELLDCKLAGITVLDLSSYFERALGQVRIDSLRASWLIFGDGFRQGLTRTVVKRVFDIAAGLLLLVLTLPLMLIAAILITLESGFPMFYRQERVGQGGRIFQVVKFRSMCADAEKDGQPRWAVSNDDRVTRVGRFIRKYRIDELPQLLNVLKGDMSLVGPRPERSFFVDELTRQVPFYAARHSIKPGLTGWAQVRYHYGASQDDAVKKLQFDLYYVKNHTLFLDLVILFETVVVVVTGRGAQ